MCLIINLNRKTNPNSFISDTDLEYAINRNSDGIGVMYPYLDTTGRQRLHVSKMMGSLEDQRKFYDEHLAKAGKANFACHLRMRTSGATNLDNVHPFKVLSIDDGDPKDLYMMHNGIIKEYEPPTASYVGKRWDFTIGEYRDIKTGKVCDEGESDTSRLISTFLQPLFRKTPRLVRDKILQEHIEDKILKSSNKLLFMDNFGKTYIYNRDQGHDKNGAWLSNTYSLPPTTTTYYGGGYPEVGKQDEPTVTHSQELKNTTTLTPTSGTPSTVLTDTIDESTVQGTHPMGKSLKVDTTTSVDTTTATVGDAASTTKGNIVLFTKKTPAEGVPPVQQAVIEATASAIKDFKLSPPTGVGISKDTEDLIDVALELDKEGLLEWIDSNKYEVVDVLETLMNCYADSMSKRPLLLN